MFTLRKQFMMFPAVPEQILWLDALRRMRRFFWGHSRCSHGGSVKFVAPLCLCWQKCYRLIWVSLFEQVPLMQSHVSLELVMCQSKRRWSMTDEDAALSVRVVLCNCRVNSQTQLSSGAARGAENCSSRPSAMVMSNSNEDILSLVPCGSSLCWIWFKTFPRWPCTCSNQCHRVSVGDIVPLNSWRGEGANLESVDGK